MGQLDGKTALITGGAGGIGTAIARRFAAEGAQVILADINPDGAARLAEDISGHGGLAMAMGADVTRAEDVQAMFTDVQGRYGALDILVNNAGWSATPAPLHEIDQADWVRVLDVCLTGVFLCTKYALPGMIASGGGCIINMASIAGLVGAPGISAYAAAKAGVIELTRTVAAEYARYNIRCNALAPGWTQTAMLDDFIGGDEKREAGLLKATPQRRFGQPGEIAAAALFLAAGEAAFMHGQTLVLDGGLTII